MLDEKIKLGLNKIKNLKKFDIVYITQLTKKGEPYIYFNKKECMVVDVQRCSLLFKDLNHNTYVSFCFNDYEKTWVAYPYNFSYN